MLNKVIMFFLLETIIVASYVISQPLIYQTYESADAVAQNILTGTPLTRWGTVRDMMQAFSSYGLPVLFVIVLLWFIVSGSQREAEGYEFD